MSIRRYVHYEPRLNKIKKCSICLCEKVGSEFSKAPKNLDGLSGWCLKCTNKRHRELYPLRRKPRTKEQNRKHREMQKKRNYTLSGWAFTALQGCKDRHECSITKQDIVDLWNKQNGLCVLTHQPMDLRAIPRAHNRPSIDRINSDVGYHINNIRLVWHFVNQARNRFSDKEFVTFCRIVVAANPHLIGDEK
jgi:hypothetical protein